MIRKAILASAMALAVYSVAPTLALTMALAVQTGFVNAANAEEPAASFHENWVNVSDAFTKQIGVHDIEPEYAYIRRCSGLIVTPTGDIVMQSGKKGICVSTDQGATWSVVADNKIAGICEEGFGFSIAYPYDGRMAFFCHGGASFCHDGSHGTSGGMSLDGGKTWKPFSQLQRGVELADVDWNSRDPQTIIGLTHEPYFTVLSDDGGKSWRQLYKNETGSGPEVSFCLGIIDGKTLARGTRSSFTYSTPASVPNNGIIELSKDAGQTWTQVANYQVVGRRPVHYGRNVYWTTSKGVITTANGKDWTLTGEGAQGAIYGPYFGVSKQEFVVVTDKYFLKTVDGGKTWKPIAKFYKAPDIFHNSEWYCYFGWDSKHNILYASGLGASVYRLKLSLSLR